MRAVCVVVICLLNALVGPAVGGASAQNAAQPEPIKIGLVIPLTGPSSAIGRQLADAAKLYMTQHGDAVAGRKIELLVRDDAGVADNAKKLAQDLIINDKVMLLGVGLPASALAIAPIASEAKIPTVIMASGTAALTEASPYYVRSGASLGQQSGTMAAWTIKDGGSKAVAIISDAAFADEAGKAFAQSFEHGGGRLLDRLKVALANPDFASGLQRAHDLQADTLFVAVPAAQAGSLARQFTERGLDKAGIRLVGPGDLIDDDDLASSGDALAALVTAGVYSATHPSQLNKDYVAAYRKATGHRANFTSVAAFDGLSLIYQALQQTAGNTDADALLESIKGMKWESPRGTVAIDPRTREMVQNVYIRRIQKVGGEPWAIEFATYPAVKDPLTESAAN